MRKKTLVILFSALCVVILGVTGIFIIPSLTGESSEIVQTENKPMEPDEFTTYYFSLIDGGKYEELYTLLSEQSQNTITAEDFITKNRNIYGGIGAKNLSVTIGQISDYDGRVDESESGNAGKLVEYSVRMDTAAGEIAYSNHSGLRMNENNEYRMEWSPQVIFPSLTWYDRVRVNTLTAERGCIYDRNGEMLAGPGVASAIGFVPGKMRREETASIDTDTADSTDNPDTADASIPESEPATVYNPEDITRVSELLETTPESILKKLNASYVNDDTFVLLQTVSKETYDLKEELLTIPGILISDTPVRYYPLGEKASHLVGYIQGINAEELESFREQGYHTNSVLGKDGLEKIYEDQLRAVDGCEIIIVDEAGNLKETLAKKDKTDGGDIP